MSFPGDYNTLARCNDGFPGFMMLSCCCKKKRYPAEKRILFYRNDQLNLSCDGFSDSETSSLDKSFELSDKPMVKLTSLNTIQPKAKELLALRRTYSTEDDPFRSRSSSVRSWSSVRSRSSSASSGSLSLTDRSQKFNRQFSSISVRSHSQLVYPNDTYPIDVSRISSNIKDSILPSTDEQDDDSQYPMNTSIYCRQVESAKVRCQVQAIQQKKGFVLKLLVADVTGLPYKGRGILYDPMLALSLQPGSHQPQHSHSAQQTLNPSFNQTFTFLCKSNHQRRQSVRITIYDSARRKEFMEIGHAILPDIEDISEESTPRDCQLSLSKSSLIHGNIGELFLSLSYSRKEKCLSVGVLRGRRLVIKDEPRYANTELRFKVTILLGGKNVTAQNSKVISHSPCPFINEFFEFYMPRKFFDEVTLIISLVERGLLTRSVIGRVVIGPYDQRDTSPINYWGLVIQSGRTLKDCVKCSTTAWLEFVDSIHIYISESDIEDKKKCI